MPSLVGTSGNAAATVWGGCPGREVPSRIPSGFSHIQATSCAVRRARRDLRRKEPSVASAVINVAPEGNLSRYLQEIRKFPMLSPEEELSLSKRWRDHQDMEAAHKLVTSHLRLVAKIAMGYRGYGLPVGELISEGNVGMMQAVKRFDPDRGFRLATYAMWWITRGDPGIHPALLVAGEDGHHRGAEEAVLQPAPAEGPDAGDRRRRPATRTGGQDRPDAGRAGTGCREHEPPPGGA